MAIGVIAGLQGITDEELNELALAVAAELSRRQAENLAAPEPGAEPPAATSQAEAIALTTQYGRVWHNSRQCRHLRHVRRVLEHAEPPWNLPLCKTCAQRAA